MPSLVWIALLPYYNASSQYFQFSAIHRNLADRVAQGLFRKGLSNRINFIELRVPALREWPKDVPDIAADGLQQDDGGEAAGG